MNNIHDNIWQHMTTFNGFRGNYSNASIIYGTRTPKKDKKAKRILAKQWQITFYLFGGVLYRQALFIYIYICIYFWLKNPQFPEPVLRRQIDSAIHRAAPQCTRQWTISILNRVFLSGCIINYSDVICIVSGLMIIFRVGTAGVG